MMLSLGRGLSPVCKVNPVLSLKSVILSCVFDLDATKSLSYPGIGQVWKNLVPVPADTSTQTAYDFYLGASPSTSTDDPVFIGSAGSASAYFAPDGGDFFRLSANTSFLKNLQKTNDGTNWWWACAFRYASSASASTFFGSRISSSTPGISLQASNTSQIQLGMRGDTVNATTSPSALAALISGTDYLLIGTFSAGSSTFRWWLNSGTKTTVSFTPNMCVSDASAIATIGSSAGGGSQMANGSRLYAVSMGNAFIDDAEAVKIINTYNARHGRTYA